MNKSKNKNYTLLALMLGMSGATIYFFGLKDKPKTPTLVKASDNNSHHLSKIVKKSPEGENLNNLIEDSKSSLNNKKEEILKELQGQISQLEKEASNKKVKIETSNKKLKENQTLLKEKVESLKKIQLYKKENLELNAELAKNKNQIQVLSKELGELKNSTKTSDLEREVISLRSKLKLKEEEVFALNKKLGILPSSSPNPFARTVKKPIEEKNQTRTPNINPPKSTVVSPRPAEVTTKDLTVKILVPKANLRTGPGEEHGVLQQIPMGVELLAEARAGEWYRVISPTGRRAFVSSKVVEPSTGKGKANTQKNLSPFTKRKPRKAAPKAPPGFVPFNGSDLKKKPKDSKSKKRTAEEKAFELIKKKIQDKKLEAPTKTK